MDHYLSTGNSRLGSSGLHLTPAARAVEFPVCSSANVGKTAADKYRHREKIFLSVSNLQWFEEQSVFCSGFHPQLLIVQVLKWQIMTVLQNL